MTQLSLQLVLSKSAHIHLLLFLDFFFFFLRLLHKPTIAAAQKTKNPTLHKQLKKCTKVSVLFPVSEEKLKTHNGSTTTAAAAARATKLQNSSQ
jgi:hypothetical protein